MSGIDGTSGQGSAEPGPGPELERGREPGSEPEPEPEPERERDAGHEARSAVTLVGDQWSPRCSMVRTFLTRSEVAYTWLRPGDPRGGRLLADHGLTSADTPVLLDDAGRLLRVPTHGLEPVAEWLGLHTDPGGGPYDLVVIGGGPAGMAAAVYGASEGLRTVLVERYAIGGQSGLTSRIENYLGFPDGISGAELADRARRQTEKFGAEVVLTRYASALTEITDAGPAAADTDAGSAFVVAGTATGPLTGTATGPVAGSGTVTRSMTASDIVSARTHPHTPTPASPRFTVTFADGGSVTSRAVIIATGANTRTLHAPGVADFVGRGVYYFSALTEAPLCTGAEVYIVGGANSAGQAAIYFSECAHKVVLLVRGDSLEQEMSTYLIKQIEAIAAIEVRPHTEVAAAAGDSHLEHLTLRDTHTDATETVEATWLFAFIGADPDTAWLGPRFLRDDTGCLVTGNDIAALAAPHPAWPLPRAPYHLETTVPGVFAAGDVRAGSGRRVASAVGEGSMAVMLVHKYLADEPGTSPRKR